MPQTVSMMRGSVGSSSILARSFLMNTVMELVSPTKPGQEQEEHQIPGRFHQLLAGEHGTGACGQCRQDLELLRSQRHVLAARSSAVLGHVQGKPSDGDGAGGRHGGGRAHGGAAQVGLDVHELPTLSMDCDVILEPGMVMALEPELFDAEIGVFGIEQNFVVTETGCELLTPAPQELMRLPM